MNDLLLCSLLCDTSYIKYILHHAYSIRASTYNDKRKKRINLFAGCLFIYSRLLLNFFNCLLRSPSLSSSLPHWVSQYVLNVPPTQTIAARSQSQKDMHCQEGSILQFPISRWRGVCVVIHFKSSECPYRWGGHCGRGVSSARQCLQRPEEHEVLGFNTKECITTLTPTVSCT